MSDDDDEDVEIGLAGQAEEHTAQYQHTPPRVPCRSRSPGSRLHAGHRLANRRAPDRLIPAPFNCSGSDVICLFRHVISGSLTLAFPVPT
jgi:hypothetical protein